MKLLEQHVIFKHLLYELLLKFMIHRNTFICYLFKEKGKTKTVRGKENKKIENITRILKTFLVILCNIRFNLNKLSYKQVK